MARDALAAALACALAASAVGCHDAHALDDGGLDGGAADDATEDAVVGDAHNPVDAPDAARSLRLQVMVFADRAGSEPLVGAPCVAVARTGTRTETTTSPEGRVAMELDANAGPYSFTVARAGFGARSIVGIAGDLDAVLHVQRGTVQRPRDGPEIAVTVTRRAADEHVVIAGVGLRSIPAGAIDATSLRTDATAPVLELAAIAYEPRYLETADGPLMLGPGAGVPRRGVVALDPIDPGITPPPAMLDVDLGASGSTHTVPVEIDLPVSGAFAPTAAGIMSYARTIRGVGPIPVGSGNLSAGTRIRGDLVILDDGAVVPDALELRAVDDSLRTLFSIVTTTDALRIAIPPIDVLPTISGGSVSELRFLGSAPGWSWHEVGLARLSDDGNELIEWTILAPASELDVSFLETFPPLDLETFPPRLLG